MQNHQEKRTYQSDLWESEAQTETRIIRCQSAEGFLSIYYVSGCSVVWKKTILIIIINRIREPWWLLVDTTAKPLALLFKFLRKFAHTRREMQICPHPGRQWKTWRLQVERSERPVGHKTMPQSISIKYADRTCVCIKADRIRRYLRTKKMEET